MKEKILPFLIGLLVGAIIATAGFLIYSKSITNNDNNPQMNQNGENGEPPEMPNGNNYGEPPEMPNGSEPPAKPEN